MIPQLTPDQDTQPLFPPQLPGFLLQSRSSVSYPPRKQQRQAPLGWLPKRQDGRNGSSSSAPTRMVPTASGGEGTSGSGSGSGVRSGSSASSSRGVLFGKAAAFSIGAGAGAGAVRAASP